MIRADHGDHMGKRSRAAAVLLLICLALSLLPGCVGPIGRTLQKSWVNDLDKIYEDDEFTYEGPSSGEYGQDSSTATFSSEEYPDRIFYVIKKDGELYTDYNNVIYQEKTKEYFEEYFEDFFDGVLEYDFFELWFHQPGTRRYLPAEDLSFKQYLKKYVDCNSVHIDVYKKDGIFPTDEQMEQIMIDICLDRDEICSFDIWFATRKTDKTYEYTSLEYKLHMKDEKIVNIYVSKKDLETKEHEGYYLVQDKKI